MSDRKYYGPVLFRNGIGTERYQPTLASGERLYLDDTCWADDLVKTWLLPAVAGKRQPVLYRWRKAARLSAREARRRECAKMSHWHEVAPVTEEKNDD